MTTQVDRKVSMTPVTGQRSNDELFARLWILFVVAGWLLLGMFSIHVSSMGALISDIPTESGIVAGEANALRSDEYARQTPLLLGLAAVGNTEFVTPLTNGTFLTSAVPDGPSGRWLETLMFPEFGVMALGDVLPDGPLYALSFWFTSAVVVALLPGILVAFGVRFWVAAAATLLVAVSPVVAWWSLRPLFAIFPGVVAVACWLAATRVGNTYRWLRILLLALIAGIALARIPWSYPPYSLPLSGAMVAIGLIYLLGRRGKWQVILVSLVVSGAVSVLMTLLVIRFNEVAFEALTNTVYPGERRNAGQNIGLGRAFGAPFNGSLPVNGPLLQSNSSEVSSAWSFAVVLWLALVIGAWRSADRAWRIRAVLVAAVLAVGFSWFLIDWPTEVGTAIPGLNLIQSTRMGEVWGMVVVVAVALAFAGRPRWPVLAAATVGTAVLLFAAGRDFQSQYVPDMSLGALIGVTLVTSGIVVLLMLPATPWRTFGMIAALAGAVATIYHVNPVQRGLQPLRGTPAAETVTELAGDRDPAEGYWATDTFWFGALLAANGVPAMSGETWTGPSQKWRLLDPTGVYEPQWNRAVSKTQFGWEPGLPEPVIESIVADDIRVRIDPCSPTLDELNVTFVVNSQPLDAPCLAEKARGIWAGTPFIIYQRSGAGQLM